MSSKLEISRELALFESILGKNPDAFLHEPVYQVTQSEVLEFARQIAAPVVEPVPPLIQTLHANGDRIAMEATIAQQAQRIADLEAAPVVERQEPVQIGYIQHSREFESEFAPVINRLIWTMPFDRRHTIPQNYKVMLYAEQPAPVAVAYPSVDEVMKLVLNYQLNVRKNVTGTTNWAANLGMHIIDKLKELNQ